MEKFTDYLPEDIFIEIFLLLPVKSLLRFKPVFMAWLSIISNPNFIKSHTQRVIVNPSALIIGKPTLGNKGLKFIHSVYVSVSVHNNKDLFSSRLLCFNCVVMPRVLNPSWSRFNSCCNGIICLHDLMGEIVYLWNPSIRRYKKPSAPLQGLWMFAIRFGCDSIFNDYKVLKIVKEMESDEVPKVYVYSTNADYCRLFQGPIPENIELYDGTYTYVNEALYFHNIDELISFDLYNEVFRTIPYPSTIRGEVSNVLDFEGSVAMVFEITGPGYDLWTLNEVYGHLDWTKKISIDADFMWGVSLYRYLGAGQFYGHKTFYGYFMFDNILNDNEKKETLYQGIPEEAVFATLNYTVTLVSIDGFVQVE